MPPKKQKTEDPPPRGIIPLNMEIPNIEDFIREVEAQPIAQPPKKSVIKKKTQPQPPPIPKRPAIKKKSPEEVRRLQTERQAKLIAKQSIELSKLKKDLEQLKQKPNKKVKTIYNPFKREDVQKNKRNIDSILRRIDEPIKATQDDFIGAITANQQDKISQYEDELIDVRFGGTVRFNASLDDLPAIYAAIQNVFKTSSSIKILVKPKDRAEADIFTYNDVSSEFWLVNMQHHLTREQLEGYSFSDAITSIYKTPIEWIQIVVPDMTGKSRKRKGGAFFPYYNTTHFDLARYGIYRETDEPDYNENCLLYAFRLLGMEETKLNELKLLFKTREIPQNKLKELAEKLKICIELKNDTRNEINIYGCGEEVYKLGLLEQHYFINEPIKISKFCMENYYEIKDIKDCNLIIKKEGDYYRKKREIDNTSFKIIKTMLTHKDLLLKEIEKDNKMMTTPYYKKLEIGLNLEYPDECCKLTNTTQEEAEESKKDIIYEKIFVDIETPVDENGNFAPFVLVAKKEGVKSVFCGVNCITKFLNSLETNSMLIAHNMGGFDGSFFIKYLMNINECTNGNNTISTTGMYYNHATKKTIRIFLKDSYTLIHYPIRLFPQCFFTADERRKIRKEVIPYQQMKLSTFLQNKGIATIEEAYKYIGHHEVNQFNKNLDEWKLRRNNGMYDLLSYTIHYCKIDVDILEKGYEVFRAQVLNSLNMDIDDVLTIASLADKYLISRGCYDGVYMLSGVPREYIQKCLVGGRTMTRANKKFIIKNRVVPLDANSLYPSAICEMGFLLGRPKVIYSKNYDEISKYDGYFIRIKILNVGKKYDFPLLSKLDNKGVRQFTNDMINEVIFIDKIALDDAIKWQGLEFEIIDGYYFNEGFNYKCKEVIKDLYQKRLTYKKLGNPVELVYKEILNCSYGKTIMKAAEHEFKYINSDSKFENYFQYNYNYILNVSKITTDYHSLYRVKKIKPINNHFSRPHIGVSILSQSKRIMNDVICLAENSNLDIFYQDTDSLFMKEAHIALIEDLYKTTYNKALIGDELGQFKRDFKLEFGEADEFGNKKKSSNVWSDYNIFLGKKAYFNKLEGMGKEGEQITGNKITLKGISGQSIETYSELKGVAVQDIFENLFNDSKTKFDLLCRDVNNIIRCCKMKRNADKTIKIIDDNFDREVSFASDKALYEGNKFIGGYRD